MRSSWKRFLSTPSDVQLELSPLAKSLLRTVRFARDRGARQIALAFEGEPPAFLLDSELLDELGPTALLDLVVRDRESTTPGAVPIWSLPTAVAAACLDAIIIVHGERMAWILRWLEPLLHSDLLVLPADPEWIVPAPVRALTREQALQQFIPVEYVARSGLTGHYLEFGTFWGRSFFPAFWQFRHWLSGQFYGFDSFEGLSSPLADETHFTGGDFRKGTYNFNVKSFRALAELLGMDADRLRVVPGFYCDSLVGVNPARYGLEPESVSVCIIDCDLLEPTRQVLDFVEPLLQPGCLLYFDDWRLCRASPTVGERAAAFQWVAEKPRLELVELYQSHWQNQYFIFNRRPPGSFALSEREEEKQ